MSCGYEDLWWIPAFKYICCLILFSSFLQWESEAVRTWGCEDVRLWGREAVRTWGCEDVRLWGREAVRTWGCEDVRLWGREAVRTWGCKDMRLWGHEAVRTWGCEDMRLWGREAVRLWGREAHFQLCYNLCPLPIHCKILPYWRPDSGYRTLSYKSDHS